MSRSSFVLSPADIKIDTSNPSNCLGEGTFGVVYKATYHMAPVAVKQLKMSSLGESLLEEFRQETEVMSQLRFPHIVQFYGFTSSSPYRIVMEYLPNGSLYSSLQSKKALSWEQRYQWATEIALGLSYLHNLPTPILHRDLKSPNVLLDQKNQAKLSDFGLAVSNLRSTTQTMTKSHSQGAVGSTRWMAPELLGIKPKYSTASDMFAYAMVLWELAARQIPYSEVFDDGIVRDAVRGGERTDIPAGCPELLRILMTQCWDQDPGRRPSAKQAAKHLQQTPLQTATPRPATAASYGYAANTAAEPIAASGYAFSMSAVQAALPTKAYVPAPGLFSAPAARMVDTRSVEKLLLHVARGEQDEAESMVKSNQNLLLHKGSVTDYSNRTFKKITGFQYALWALDWHMWKMLAKYLPMEAQREQLQDLDQNGSEHGKNYDYNELLQALKTYIDNFDKLYAQKDWDQLKRLWVKGVGGAQSRVPAHVANEYCHPSRPFAPVPSFTESDLPRRLYHGVWTRMGVWYPLHSGGQIAAGGVGPVALWRGDGPRVLSTRDHVVACRLRLDLFALFELFKVRAWQREELRRVVTSTPGRGLGVS